MSAIWIDFGRSCANGGARNPGPGAGLWFDLGPHMIDQALYLFGLPTSVSASFGILVKVERRTIGHTFNSCMSRAITGHPSLLASRFRWGPAIDATWHASQLGEIRS